MGWSFEERCERRTDKVDEGCGNDARETPERGRFGFEERRAVEGMR